VQTAIATCGTAIAGEHAELISRYCTRVVLIFDSDKAGQSATERGIDVLLR
jgi:DNA primase